MSASLRRSLVCLNIAVFFGAFNDNALKIVTAVLVLQWVKNPAASAAWIAAASAAFVVPYILFSMFAGSLADRYSKSELYKRMQWVEVILMAFATWGLAKGSLGWLIGILFLTGVQSALFSPSKYGLLPELFPQECLSWVNGVVEGILFAGILLGTLAGSFSVDLLGANLPVVGICLMIFAFIGAIAALGIPRTGRADPHKRLRINPIADVYSEWKLLRRNSILWLSTLAIGYFWFLGGLVQINILGYSRDLMDVGPRGTGVLLSALAIGVGLGSYLAGGIAGKDIWLLPVRVGIAGVAFLLVGLFYAYTSFFSVLLSLFLLGLFGGGYIVPLNTVIQARSPAGEKGRVIATTNFFSFVGILLASGVLWIMGSVLALAPSWIFLCIGIITLGISIVIWCRLPAYGRGKSTSLEG